MTCKKVGARPTIRARKVSATPTCAGPDAENVQASVESIARRATFLSPDEAACLLGLAPATLAKYRSVREGGPIYRKHGERVVYCLQDLLDWSDQRAFD